jgi:presenilin-like A22 family membrane protease
MFRRIEFRQMFDITIMFLIVQFLGLLLATMVVTTTPMSEITGPQINITDLLLYVIYIVISSVIIIFISKKFKRKGGSFLKALEAFVIFFASFIVFTVVIGYFAPSNTPALIEIIAAIILSILLVILKQRRPNTRNTVAIIASVGVGLILGLDFPFTIAFAFMAIIAVYDYIAVFITKHMLSLAKAVSENNLAFLIGTADIEAAPNSYFTKNELTEYHKMMKESGKDKDPVFQKIIEGGRIPVISQIQLGTGDLGLPLMLAVSAYASFQSLFTAIVIVCGAFIGLLFTMYFLKKYERALPAIPPLFSFICIALGIEFIFTGQFSPLISIGLIITGAAVMLVGIVFTLRAGVGVKAKKQKKTSSKIKK